MKIQATGITGEAFVLIQELWDLPVEEDRFVFYTLHVGYDCGFRSPCVLPERVGEALAEGNGVITAKFDSELAADWRESALTAVFKLRGRLNQRIHIKVWMLSSTGIPWETGSTELIAPEGSVLVAECSFMADYARGTSCEQLGWLCLSPQGAASVRKLRRRKAGHLEIMSNIITGQVYPSFTADTNNLNGRPTEFTIASDSPWDGVCATGITLTSITDLLTAIVEADAHIGKPINRYTMVLPKSAFLLALICLILFSAVGPSPYISRRLVFFLFILTGHLIRGWVDPLRRGSKSAMLNSTEVKYESRLKSRLVLASVITGLKERLPILSGMLVTILELVAIFLKCCSDICDAAHFRRFTWSEIRFVILFLSPWIFNRLWNVLLHSIYLLSFTSVMGFRTPSLITATLISLILLVCGKERYAMSGRPLWSLRQPHEDGNNN